MLDSRDSEIESPVLATSPHVMRLETPSHNYQNLIIMEMFVREEEASHFSKLGEILRARRGGQVRKSSSITFSMPGDKHSCAVKSLCRELSFTWDHELETIEFLSLVQSVHTEKYGRPPGLDPTIRVIVSITGSLKGSKDLCYHRPFSLYPVHSSESWIIKTRRNSIWSNSRDDT